MADRVEINESALENVTGGALRWKSDGKVFPKNDPNAVYAFDSFDACQEWLVTHWSGIQDERCLKAMEDAGLVHKI